MRIATDWGRLDVSKGWAVVSSADQGSLRLFFEPAMTHDEAQCLVEKGRAEVSFRLVSLSFGNTLQSYAENTMKRHVGEGEPERFAYSLDGRDARGYSWTNGVENVDTYFAELSPTTLLRIDVATACAGSLHGQAAKDARVAANDMLTSFGWK